MNRISGASGIASCGVSDEHTDNQTADEDQEEPDRDDKLGHR